MTETSSIDPLVMLCTSDVAGQLRGKAMPLGDLERRRTTGIGWTPTNIQITALGAIAPTEWGALGDLYLEPDMSTLREIRVEPDAHPLNLVLCRIMQLDGTPWSCCTRSFLARQIEALAGRGLKVKAAFEHELAFDGVEERINSSYNLDSFRRQGRLGALIVDQARRMGLEPDSFMPEYGPTQHEIVIGPAEGVEAADRAVLLREAVRSVAHHLGGRASFTPILRPGAVGNGVHVHFSLTDQKDEPVNHDADAPLGISGTASAFLEGVRRKLPALTALTAASVISYLRLVPHRWSAAYNNVGRQDREASLRICPVFGGDVARKLHFEYRAADAAASPFVLLGGILAAGIWGIERGLKLATATEVDLTTLDQAALDGMGITPLPSSLGAALDLLEADADLAAALGPELHRTYLAHKRFEAAQMRPLDPAEQCRLYAEAY